MIYASLHADQNISHCPACGSWKWLSRCRACGLVAAPVAKPERWVVTYERAAG